jgi:hypothetical protein
MSTLRLFLEKVTEPTHLVRFLCKRCRYLLLLRFLLRTAAPFFPAADNFCLVDSLIRRVVPDFFVALVRDDSAERDFEEEDLEPDVSRFMFRPAAAAPFLPAAESFLCVVPVVFAGPVRLVLLLELPAVLLRLVVLDDDVLLLDCAPLDVELDFFAGELDFFVVEELLRAEVFSLDALLEDGALRPVEDDFLVEPPERLELLDFVDEPVFLVDLLLADEPDFFDADFFLPPPVYLFTVAQPIRSACSSLPPRSFTLSSMCSAIRCCLSV